MIPARWKTSAPSAPAHQRPTAAGSRISLSRARHRTQALAAGRPARRAIRGSARARTAAAAGRPASRDAVRAGSGATGCPTSPDTRSRVRVTPQPSAARSVMRMGRGGRKSRLARCHPVRRLRRRFDLTPQAYARVTTVALVALALIVLTGAGVRLTGSGLGCPDWPKCFGSVVAPLKTHAVIEYGNRLVSGVVGLIAVGAFAGAFLRTPRRRDVIRLSALLP